MAQLIKLQDYVSRYEKDMIRYPSQFVRLKKQQWERVRFQWEEGNVYVDEELLRELTETEDREGFFDRLKKRWSKEEEIAEEEVEEPEEAEAESPFAFEPTVYYRPDSLHELKYIYLDQLFQFQLKWASSTLTEKSYVDPKFVRDECLRFLLQRLPDTYFVLYEPVMQLKKAPVELDIVLITPTELLCITLMEEADNAAYIGSPDRFWTVKMGEQSKRMLSPVISLLRMESVVKHLFDKHGIDLPIRKVILSRNGYIDYPDVPFGYTLLDRKSFPAWFQSVRTNRSPLKHMQMKAARTLLEHCQTTSVRRVQWSEDPDDETAATEEIE